MIVKPFRGLRPSSELADRIPSPPYDVLSTEEARALAEGDPHTFLHVIRPEIDLDPAVDPHDDAVYQRGRHNLRAMVEAGWLVRDEKPAYYVYRLRMEDHTQTGVVGAAAVDDYLEDRIKKHEHTRPEKEQDRVDLIEALSAHPGPIFLTYRGLPELNAAVNGVTAGEPWARFTSPDGVEHTFWVVSEAGELARFEQSFAKVPCSYVADGHHRTAAAARVAAGRRERLDNATGHEPCHFFLAVHFPSDQLRVLDYNRVVADLNGLTPEALVARIEARGFDVKADHRSRRPPHRHAFGMYVAGRWYLLTARAAIVPDDVLGQLDVSILSRSLLEPVLGIGDPRTDPRIDFVGGIRGMDELEKRVDSGRDAVAFALWPTALDEVMQVADLGQVMPPKSTWFEPKLRSGLVVQPLDGDEL